MGATRAFPGLHRHEPGRADAGCGKQSGFTSTTRVIPCLGKAAEAGRFIMQVLPKVLSETVSQRRCDWCHQWKSATWTGVSQLTSAGWEVAGGTIFTRSLRLFGDANRGNEAFYFI